MTTHIGMVMSQDSMTTSVVVVTAMAEIVTASTSQAYYSQEGTRGECRNVTILKVGSEQKLCRHRGRDSLTPVCRQGFFHVCFEVDYCEYHD